ncbi:MAG: 50S ribosomal protein L29 [Deltaproteobacteria bacterium]|nr:50S ribosomal protein L29 [Deltaproteobacteria bacterium]
MKAKEIRESSAEELLIREKELKAKLFNLRIQHATKQLTNTAQMQRVKRDIARVKTVARQKTSRD